MLAYQGSKYRRCSSAGERHYKGTLWAVAFSGAFTYYFAKVGVQWMRSKPGVDEAIAHRPVQSSTILCYIEYGNRKNGIGV